MRSRHFVFLQEQSPAECCLPSHLKFLAPDEMVDRCQRACAIIVVRNFYRGTGARSYSASCSTTLMTVAVTSPAWEPEFKLRYPTFKLENELFRKGGRDVMLSYV